MFGRVLYSARRLTRRETVAGGRRKKMGATAALVSLAGGLLVTSVGGLGVNAAPVGQGFTVTAADLSYILDQIKIGEAHVVNTTPATGPCGALLGNGPDQIPNPLLSFGIRTVDGSCNNLQAGQEKFGAADQAFPRLTTPVFNDAEPLPFDTDGPGPEQAGDPTSYAQTTGSVSDSEPRTVSNLIVDQTSDNPAAVAAAGFPVRTQGNPGIEVCTAPNTPVGCVPEHQTLFIPNVTTDVGLSPPFNGLFTIFGQFFDHGLDKITNGGAGTVFVPLKADDPLITLGPDGIPGNGDEVPVGSRFMALNRGTIVTGPDGNRSAPNTDTPFVDQSQTYTSHASHQFFLREYTSTPAGPIATAKFLSRPDGDGMATWTEIKAQASSVLGLQLLDTDVNDVPLIATDVYGNFIPGPVRGMPMVMFPDNTTQEGDPAANSGLGISLVGASHIGAAFLNDIAHAAGPGSTASPKTPDADGLTGGSLDPVAPGEYDDELLGIHFICGDGRCNENIALTSVHQIFHSEHDRLVDDIEATLALPENAALSTAYHATSATTFEYGERIFQAARFVTEMEYQHLVFEEFARKVQPAINPFEAFAFNQTDVNPAITAEFAHAVYRFGHSMLTEDIARINPDGSDNSIPLLGGFLNPASYYDGGTAGTIDSRAAATSIFMGMSDQVGNEIDEFVTNTLRNNLLGLPLDLPSINMARARSEGIPSLNNVRKQIFAATNDGQLAPYDNWVTWGQALKHPESLINFIAAYGTHPNIMGLDPDGAGPILPGGLVARRTAAEQIVNGTELPGPDGILFDDALTVCVGPNDPAGCDESADNILAPADAGDFLFSSGAWTNSGSTSLTGLDDIDLWVGGLAEVTNLFGGLLGTTFNYVFENQLTNLQNGDRFYYLARTPGMNLRSQLEGNSFSELVMRNTGAYSLKADPFATADCKFHLADITGPAAPGSPITGPGSVIDVPTTECDENRLLLRQPNGRVEYRAINSIDPSGINGQSVYDGTVGVDRVFGGNDNDTFWGREGNDIIEGRGGDDVILGGEGNDIITDSGGFDVLKGGPGNDAIDSGINDDIIMGGDGDDFTNGGANFNEHFLGAGNDFAIAGQGADAVFGDSGDDWEEGGDQPDLLIGDSSTLSFDDHNIPGHDVMIGQGGDDDSDSEGGDDIIVGGPGVEKNAGNAGFDWVIGVGDPQPQYSDLNIKILGGPAAVNARDKFNEIEALSGWNLNDQLFGDDLAPVATGGGGFLGCDVLNQAGLDRISGLDALVPPLNTLADTVLANTTTRYCLLTPGELVWGDGNILMGGAGSDRLEGRGADDILDGDKYMNVRLSVRTDVTNPDTQFASTDLMEHAATSGDFGAGMTGMTLQQAVFAGLVDPGKIAIVREVLLPAVVPSADCGAANPVNCDTAQYSGVSGNYTVAPGPNGSITVTDTTGVDGIDTLYNIEQVVFCDVPNPIRGGACLTPSAQLTLAPQAVATPAPVVFASLATGGTAAQNVTISNPGFSTLTVSSVTSDSAAFTTTTNCTTVAPGGTCTVAVTFLPTTPAGLKSGLITVNHNGVGASTTIAVSGIAVTVPDAPAAPTAVAGNARATVSWVAPANGGSAITGYSIRVLDAADAQVGALRPAGATATSLLVTGLVNGTTYHFTVTATNAIGTSPASPSSNAVTPTAAAVLTAPGAPTIGTATAGNATATATWTAPANNGGSPITGYSVRVLNAANAQVGALRPAGAADTSLVVTGLVNGTTYHFTVTATNAVGTSPASASSNAVTPSGPAPAAAPGAPTILPATRGPNGTPITATANWTPGTTGGSPITGYQVFAQVVDQKGGNAQPVGAPTVALVGATARAVTFTFTDPALNVRFFVRAVNAIGTGPASANSNIVVPR